MMPIDKSVKFRCALALGVSVLLATLSIPSKAAQRKVHSATHNVVEHSSRPLLMTHYMPWFTAKPFSGSWGWHWTMNHYNPDHIVNGRRDAPSHYYPLIGLYDSSDPDTLQCQVMLMKLAGIDGVIVDWYGNDNVQDYGVNNRNTEALIPYIQKAGMHFAVCYETQTVPNEIKQGFIQQSDVVTHGQKLMQWLQQNFFSNPAYLKIGGRPVLLSFGDPYYNSQQWEQIFSVLQVKPLYFTEGSRQVTSAEGAFDWPLPAGGTQGGLAEVDKFYERAKKMPIFIPTAFPRFDDIYAQAGVGKSWGHIDDQNGQTYRSLLTRALQSGAPIIQLVTWNDWGEGTQIEPSVEYGYRDLETTQQLRKKYENPAFNRSAKDLRLPVEWYQLRKKYQNDPAISKKLAGVFPLVVTGKVDQARALLARYGH